MEKKSKLIKNNYILINKNNITTRPKTNKERIQEIIMENEESIKKYENIKEQTNNPKKKEECLQIISRIRKQQVKLHNKLYNFNSFLNMFNNNKLKNNNIMRPKSGIDITKNIYLREYFNNKMNSSFKSSFNCSNIFPNSNFSNNNILKNKKMHRKFNSNLSSIIDNGTKNILKKPIKKINIISTKRKENNQNKNNKNYFQLFLNTTLKTRQNVYLNENSLNSTLFTCTSIKNDINKLKSNKIIVPINTNNKIYSSKKNIFIINNINNFSGKIKNNSTKNRDKNYKNLNRYNNHIVNKNVKKKIKNNILKYNIIDEDEQLDMNINYDIEEKKINLNDIKNIDENIEFKTNPNLSIRKKYFKVRNNSLIELYHSYHDNNELYMAKTEKTILGYNIKIIKFKNREFVTRLKKHNNKIIIIKHFFNLIKLHDFIISGDIDHIINIWDVSYKYSINQFIYSIIYNGNNIYKILNISIEENENNNINNYLLIYDNSINVYKLSNGNFIKNINHYPLKEEKIINLIKWKNKDNNLDYIIKCSEHKIVIFNFIDEDIFFELSNYKKNNDDNSNLIYKSEGYISSFQNLDYLFIFTSDMNLEIWDLYNLSLKENISININLDNDNNLLNIVPWNNKYLLIIDEKDNFIYVIDIISNIIVSKIVGSFKNNNKPIYFKKIMDKKYGESLLLWCNNRHISLLSTHIILINIFD